MLSMPPKFSIIIPTHYRAEWLPKALLSVTKQTNNDWECIIVNDGGCDKTLKILKALDSTRFQYYNLTEKTGSVAKARNIACKLAKNEWLVFLDDDDQLLPQALDKLAKKIQETNHADFIMPGIRFINENDEFESSGHDAELKEIFFSSLDNAEPQDVKVASRSRTNGLCVRKNAFFSAGEFDTDYKVTSDREFVIRLLLTGCSFASIAEPLIKVILHDEIGLSQSSVQTHIEYGTKLFHQHKEFFDRYPLIGNYFLNRLVAHYKKAGMYREGFKYAKQSLLYKPSEIRSLRRFIEFSLKRFID